MFEVGDYVNKGEFIARVYFQGLAHVHLSRIFVEYDEWSNYHNWMYRHPDRYFIYEDTQPPVIKEPLYYFHNNSDSLFQGGTPTYVSGKVDIVAGMRDQGEFAHSKESGFGDRLCVAKIEYEITPESGTSVLKKSFDFTKIITKENPLTRKERVLTVFKHYLIFHPGGLTSGNKTYCYYIITNTDGTGDFGLIDPSAADFSWDTTETGNQGDPIFPNGMYTITITAYDFKGNSTSVSDVVMVEN